MFGREGAHAQVAAGPSESYVTKIVTNYRGFWRSGTGLTLNYLLAPTLPDNSHQPSEAIASPRS